MYIIIAWLLIFCSGLVWIFKQDKPVDHLIWYIPSMAAILTALLGIFKNWIESKVFSAKMHIIYDARPPYLQMMPLVNIQDNSHCTDAHCIKVEVNNDGGKSILLNVEAQMSSVFYKSPAGKYERTKLIPQNLRWSHEAKPSVEKYTHIQKDMRAFLDIGNLIDAQKSNIKSIPEYQRAKNKYPLSKVLFEISTLSCPTSGDTILEKGEYLLEVVFAATNHKQIRKYYKLNFQDTWEKREDDMRNFLNFAEIQKNEFEKLIKD